MAQLTILVSYVQTLRKIAPNFCGLLRKLYLQSFQRKSSETTFTQGFVGFSAKNGVELFLFSLKICRQICLLNLILCGLEEKSLYLHLISSFSWIYTHFKKFKIWLRCIKHHHLELLANPKQNCLKVLKLLLAPIGDTVKLQFFDSLIPRGSSEIFWGIAIPNCEYHFSKLII